MPRLTGLIRPLGAALGASILAQHQYRDAWCAPKLKFPSTAIQSVGARPEAVREWIQNPDLPAESQETRQLVLQSLCYQCDMSEFADICADAESGKLLEAFACGTAAVVTPIGVMQYQGRDYRIGHGQEGEVTRRLRETICEIHTGTSAVHPEWIEEVPRFEYV